MFCLIPLVLPFWMGLPYITGQLMSLTDPIHRVPGQFVNKQVVEEHTPVYFSFAENGSAAWTPGSLA